MERIRKFCADPQKNHKKKIYSHVRKVTSSLLAKCDGTNIELKKDSYLCVNCLKTITKKLDTSKEKLQSRPKVDIIVGDESNDGDNDKSSNDICVADQLEASIKMEKVLPLLEQTPIKKSKYKYYI